MSANANGRTRWVRFLTRTLVVLAVVVAVVLALAAWALLLRSEHDIEAGRPVQLEIVQGSSTASIGAKLAEAGVIDNRYLFRLRARLAGADGAMSPGVYELTTGMSYSDVLDLLRSGPPITTVKVAIPEGFVIDQIAERLEERAGVPAKKTRALAKGGAEEFVADHPYLAAAHEGSLEGYLFPKTYRLPEGATAREALEAMLDQFDKEIVSIDLARAQEDGFDLHEVVTVASIIEREAVLDEERALVSSVIRNRLARGMPLEIDATVEYVLPGNRFRLRYSDLRVDSPYNTYRVKGLPPGPIASPGLASLRAAVAPSDTRYLYYVLTGKDGSHTFTTTKSDFLKAKQKSKEVFGR